MSQPVYPCNNLKVNVMQSNLKIWAVGLTFLISASGAIAKPPAHAKGGNGKKAVVEQPTADAGSVVVEQPTADAGSVGVEQPTADAGVGCAVLVPEAINAGLPYTVKVVRVPSYPGGWFSPTIVIDATYPATQGNEIGDSREQTIAKMGVTYATATFTVPEAFDPNTNEPVIRSGGTANINATVSEPMNDGNFNETTCTATTVVY